MSESFRLIKYVVSSRTQSINQIRGHKGKKKKEAEELPFLNTETSTSFSLDVQRKYVNESLFGVVGRYDSPPNNFYTPTVTGPSYTPLLSKGRV